MGMKKKMAQVASMAVMMALANGDEVYCDLPAVQNKKAVVTKGETKKCKSCRHFKYCQEKPKPMKIACGNYERRKKK